MPGSCAPHQIPDYLRPPDRLPEPHLIPVTAAADALATCSWSRTWHRPDSRTRSPAGPHIPPSRPRARLRPDQRQDRPKGGRRPAGPGRRRKRARRARARSQPGCPSGRASPAAALVVPTAQPNFSCPALGRKLGVSAVLASVFALASWPDKENRSVRVRGTLQDLASPDAGARSGASDYGSCAGDQDRGEASARAQAARSPVKRPDARLASCNDPRM